MVTYGTVIDGTYPLGAMLPVLQERVVEWRWGMHPMWWIWGTGGLVMMLMMLVFWAVVIAGLVVGIRWLLSQGRTPTPDSALAILRDRYARGEINREEFEAKRRDLDASRR
jgi:putative membrane protein